jgi:ferritin-like metal-binding protein YciE
MGLMTSIKAGTKSLDKLDDLLVEELKDLYDVEQRISDALPKMKEAASRPDLKKAFEEHRAQTDRQKERLEQCFRHLDMKPDRGTCEGIKGILDEGEVFVKADGDPKVKDAALLASAQRVEHYEMASYGSARAFAQHLNHKEVADLLQQTLDEEGQTDHDLTELALADVNPPSSRPNV